MPGAAPPREHIPEVGPGACQQGEEEEMFLSLPGADIKERK